MKMTNRMRIDHRDHNKMKIKASSHRKYRANNKMIWEMIRKVLLVGRKEKTKKLII